MEDKNVGAGGGPCPNCGFIGSEGLYRRQGLELIKHFEGVRLEAYKCPSGLWTIGYGNTYHPCGQPISKGETITLDQAEDYLLAVYKEKEMIAKAAIGRHLEHHELAAATSFCYNAGTGYKDKHGVFQLYNLWAHIREETITPAYWQGLAITSEGKVLEGLKRRRRAESKLYFEGVLDFS